MAPTLRIEPGPPDVAAEAERLYEAAVARRDRIQEEWEAMDSPLLSEGSTGQSIEHPLVKMLREHEILIERLAVPLRKRHRGPQASAVLTTAIGKSPAALRRAK